MPVISIKGLLADYDTPQAILSNTINPDEAFAMHGNADVIAIEFNSYADGRGSSLAVRLRRLGFAGKLRAIGPLIPDQFSNLLACGFDEVEISDDQLLRQPISQWLAALQSQKLSYQQNSKFNFSIPKARIEQNNAD